MKEKLQKFLYGISVMKNNFVFHVTEDVMSALVEGGIPQYFLAYIEDVILREMTADPATLKKFDVQDLEFGFVIYLVSCGLSIVVFLIEKITFFYLKKI